MKAGYTILTALAFSLSMISNAQQFQTLTDRNGKKLLKGFITDSLLRADTSFKWFNEAQNIYTPKENVVADLKAAKDSMQYVIFLGTWCGDSHFIIPRFLKTLQHATIDKTKFTLIAVDRTKKDLTNLASAFHITNVPTVIVFKNGKEVGRVIEYGSTGKYDEEVAALVKQK